MWSAIGLDTLTDLLLFFQSVFDALQVGLCQPKVLHCWSLDSKNRINLNDPYFLVQISKLSIQSRLKNKQSYQQTMTCLQSIMMVAGDTYSALC